ncbi:SNF2 domain-containing protein [Actinidia rufa]|uniref:SNF2 domain-containing protein n=1 Tax=Actinidia rufa TaxID=165716 RepID=A0A7J0FX99_9ERIC|nr:SNF2 domain-containing protein [Actinidia rufa]
MLMADDGSDFWPFEDFSAGDDDSDPMEVDFQSLWKMLGENPDPAQNTPGDTSAVKQQQGMPASAVSNDACPLLRMVPPELERTSAFGPSYNSEASDSRVGVSDGYFESVGKSVVFANGNQDASAQTGSQMHSWSGSLADWMLQVSGHDSSSAENGSHYPFSGEPDINYGKRCVSAENTFTTSRAPEIMETPMMDMDIHFPWPPDDSFNNQFISNSNKLVTNMKNEQEDLPTQIAHINGATMSEAQVGQVGGAVLGAPMISDFKVSVLNIKGEGNNFISRTVGNPFTKIDERFVIDKTLSKPLSFTLSNMSSKKKVFIKDERNDGLVASKGMPSAFSKVGNATSSEISLGFDCGFPADKHSKALLHPILLSNSSKKLLVRTKDEKEDLVLVSNRDCHTLDNIDQTGSKNVIPVSGDHCLEMQAPEKPCTLPSSSRREQFGNLGCRNDERETKLIQPKSSDTHNSKVNCQIIHSNAMVNSHVDDSSDLCILEDRSEPACSIVSSMNRKSLVTSQHSTSSEPLNHMGVKLKVKETMIFRVALQDLSQPKTEATPPDGVLAVSLLRHQIVNGRDNLRCLLQTCHGDRGNNNMGIGILKGRYETALHTLPHTQRAHLAAHACKPGTHPNHPLCYLDSPEIDGRIALSWMVKKETASLHCSGGILADDQGLGKTISAIALILKERAPSSRACPDSLKQNEIVTLNLDEDDDCVSKLDRSKQYMVSNGTSLKGRDTSMQAMGRPAAGTLVVCPTSVLRQWADELHNKVTTKANLSVLVYHGSNRTKDPFELAKYDVVLTTYSIVSMEVPKQPLVDKDDDETGRQEAHVVHPMGDSLSKKRKYPSSSGKKSLKDKKGMDSALFESSARPLAQVGWFRVVLDEAQSIKNHRTQVARACWGLRAKRRWCLSGTPIQNAVDDLYSYFRFLKYDPYAVYKSFCSRIKFPINRNPTKGYRKLQAVLKTIMLRRTKGTLLDGEPIINLPPKSVELKKVDFTKEERDFYCRLETDSRAQFAEYAAAGTVKQNYVNILLMLLRLRQACDHPLLVRGRNSSSAWRSSIEVAKKLPREKQSCLLNCSEASLAICGICNDPPEDAVVTNCGHVFCNQCICEHLTGDDNQCPTKNCKTRLSLSVIFSKDTLKNALSEQSGHDSAGTEVSDKLEPGSWSQSFYSSKIKAALEFLQSLSKPSHCTPGTSSLKSIDDERSTCPENSSDPVSRWLELDERNSDLDKGLNDSIKVAGEKAIVFSQWTRMLDLLETSLKNSSIQYRRLDGTMSVVARDKAVKDFNALPEVSVMIMSLKAASLGLNMVAACRVILLDLWWNPTTEDQAIDRAHRIGQTRPVTVLRLTVKDTVEDRILALQQRKRVMVASAFDEDDKGSRQTRLTEEDLNSSNISTVEAVSNHRSSADTDDYGNSFEQIVKSIVLVQFPSYRCLNRSLVWSS